MRSEDFDSTEVIALKSQLSYPFGKRWRKRIYADIRKQRLKEARMLGTHTSEQWDEILRLVGFRCVRCGCRPEPRPCKDHIVPICRGGSDHVDNLQPLCRECNTSQGNSQFNWLEYRLLHGFEENQS